MEKILKTKKGKKYTITATPNQGWQFAKWVKQSDSSVITENPYVTSSQHDEFWVAHFRRTTIDDEYALTTKLGVAKKAESSPHYWHYDVVGPTSDGKVWYEDIVQRTDEAPLRYLSYNILELDKDFPELSKIDKVEVFNTAGLLANKPLETFQFKVTGGKFLNPVDGNPVVYDSLLMFRKITDEQYGVIHNKYYRTSNPHRRSAGLFLPLGANLDIYNTTILEKLDESNSERVLAEKARNAMVYNSPRGPKLTVESIREQDMLYFKVYYEGGRVDKYRRAIRLDVPVDIAVLDDHSYKTDYYITK